MFEKILVPLDGSELARGILPFVSQLAKGLNSTVVILSVCSPRKARPAGIMIKAGLDEVDELAADGITAEAIVSVGSPVFEITQAAMQEGCGLIAMSSHGRGGLGRSVFGSVTDEVIRTSGIPTLVVSAKNAKKYWHSGDAITELVVPLDGSSDAEAVLPFVEELARSLSLNVVLARVLATGGPYSGLVEDALKIDLEPDEIKAQEYLDLVTNRLKRKGVTVSSRMLKGTLPREIIELSHEMPGNMLAVTTRGHSGVIRWMEDSVTEAVVRASGDPVLVIPN